MSYTRVKRKSGTAPRDPRVYCDLDELIRLQFKARGFSYLPRQPVHSVLYGRHASRLRGRGLNFEELRRYLPGDDIRNVDWKATSRARRPYVRVYTEERDRPVWLLVDQRATMFFGTRDRLKSVSAAETAAVSAWRILGMGDRVGAIIFDDTDLTEIRPHRSTAQVMRILGQIVKKNHALKADAGRQPNPGMFNKALRAVLTQAKHDCLITIISDASGADEESRRMVTQLNQHNDVIMVYIFDPMEQALPSAGLLTMTDGAGQLEVDTGTLRVRDGVSSYYNEHLKGMRELSQKQAIPLITIGTDGPVLDQVRDQLGRQAAARRRSP